MQNQMRIISSLCLVFFILPLSVYSQEHSENEIEKQMQEAGLIDIQKIDTIIIVDLKYSSTDNFLKKDVYGDLNRCYLQDEVAKMLAHAQQYLTEIKPGYRLLVYDCTRSRRVQVEMWRTVENTEFQQYVADPKTGSIHNYGAAIDLTIMDENDQVLDMGTDFDYFGERAQPKLEALFLENGELSEKQVENRKLLRSVMEKAGFEQLDFEWWHYNAFKPEEVKKKYKPIE